MSISVTSGVERWVNDSCKDDSCRDDSCENDARNGTDASDESRIGDETVGDETPGAESPPAESIRRRVQLAYEPFPKQRDFHASRAKYRLFGGAAGPGKSKALLIEAILQAEENPGANTLLLRRTFPELEQSLLLYFRRDVPSELYKSFQESKHLVAWWNGSTTRFGYCAHEHDVYQYQGAEFLFIGIDELTTSRRRRVWRIR